MNREDIIKFARTVGELKKVKRTGWIKYGKVKDPESVADHVMRLTVLCLVFGDIFEVDTDKLVKMAIVHDLAESLVGDIVSEEADKDLPEVKEEKFNLESDAIRKLFKSVKDNDKYVKLWEEFEKQETKEARILRELDKFEMVLQALEYERDYNPENFESFWINAKKNIKNPIIKSWLEELESRRDG